MMNESLIGSALSKNIKNNGYKNCPLCGGKAERRLDKICVKIFIAFLIFAVLTLILFVIICFGNSVSLIGFLFLPFLGIITGALFVIVTITAAIAIVSRSRCKACGHRFWPASIAPNLPADVRSPGILTVIGIVIILTVFYIQAVFINNSPGNEMIGVFFEIAGLIFLTSIILGLCIIGQAFFWRNLISEIHSGKKYRILFFLPFLIIIFAAIAFPFCFRDVLAYKYNYVSRAQDVLLRANLATLPESASNIHVYTPQMIFGASDYLRFNAEPNDIEKFIAESSALKDITYVTSSNRSHDKPSWFHPKRENIRCYKFDKKEFYYRGKLDIVWKGELIVDDQLHIVYVYRYK